MRRYRNSSQRLSVYNHRQQETIALAKKAGHSARLNKRPRGGERMLRLPYSPPEDWHEPSDRVPEAAPSVGDSARVDSARVDSGRVDSGRGESGRGGCRLGDRTTGGFRFLVQPAGKGFRHILSPDDVRGRLAQLPRQFVAPLEVVQFSQMTRKKLSFPCYGMQWGTAIYLYPIEESLIEHYYRPPKPEVYNECRMYGGQWRQMANGSWDLVWTEQAIRDFYLNNILIHEMGHLLDDRNSNYTDRERYAEWFAIEYGYKPTRRLRVEGAAEQKFVRRRHNLK
jgi:hypothetical protein